MPPDPLRTNIESLVKAIDATSTCAVGCIDAGKYTGGAGNKAAEQEVVDLVNRLAALRFDLVKLARKLT